MWKEPMSLVTFVLLQLVLQGMKVLKRAQLNVSGWQEFVQKTARISSSILSCKERWSSHNDN